MKNEFITKTVKLEEMEQIDCRFTVITYKDINEKSEPVGDIVKVVVRSTNIASTAWDARYIDITLPTNLDPNAIVVR